MILQGLNVMLIRTLYFEQASIIVGNPSRILLAEPAPVSGRRAATMLPLSICVNLTGQARVPETRTSCAPSNRLRLAHILKWRAQSDANS